MSVYYPKVRCVLGVPEFGLTVERIQQEGQPELTKFDVLVHSCEFRYNDHLQADEAEIEIVWQDTGVDPRLLRQAVVWLYMKGSESPDYVSWSDDDIRFVGICTRVKKKGAESGGLTLKMEFQDFTQIFLATKPFPAKARPSYQDTLRTAWEKICDNTGTYFRDPATGEMKIFSLVQNLRDRLVSKGGVDLDQPLSQSVPTRLASLGTVAAKPEFDAWAVWQSCVFSLGLISFIDEDRCIVTTTTERFGKERAPRFIWGRNITDIEESTDAKFAHRGVILTSYDSLTGRVIEAIHPDPSDPRIQKKNVSAQRKQKLFPGGVDTSKYVQFEYHDIVDLPTLQKLAERAYIEISRQQLEGTFRTSEMWIETIDNGFLDSGGRAAFDILELRAGDPIRVEIDEAEKHALWTIGDDQAQVAYLLDRGYQFETAQLIVRNMKALPKLEPTMHAKAIRVRLETSGDSGNFEVDVQFENLINVSGDTEETPEEKPDPLWFGDSPVA